MNCLKKTIVLSNKQDDYSALCVLTLLKSRQGTFGALRSYDLGTRSAVLGISINNKQVFKQNVEIVNNKTYNFKLDKSFDIDSKIGCVLVENIDGRLKPIVYGSSDEIKDYKSVVIDGLNNAINNVFVKRACEASVSYENPSTLNSPETESETCEENIERDVLMNKNEASEQALCLESEEIHKMEEDCLEKSLEEEFLKEEQRLGESFEESEQETITKNLVFDDDSSMKEVEEQVIFPKAHEDAKLFDSTNEEIEQDIETALNASNEFYNMISEQIDELFLKYPRENMLEQLIPESKWVKVDYENDGHFYVIGLIYEDAVLQYVCYGVPGEFSLEPPRELEKYSQWLPLNPKEPEGEGYWIMYQDADSGDAVELNFA